MWFLLESAPFPHPLPFIDWIAIFLQIVIDGAGITGNVALLLAIVYKSPKMFSSYKILLTNGAVVDLIAAATCLLSIERMIPSSFGTAMVCLGPCTLVSPLLCHCLHSVMMNAQTHSLYLVSTSFFYRLYILKHQSPSRQAMIVIALAFLLVPIFMGTCTFFSIDDETEVRDAFRTIYNLDDYVVQGHLGSHPRLALKFSKLYTAGSALPVTIIVILTLDAQSSVMSERTANVHKTLVKASPFGWLQHLPDRVLTQQACLPVIFTLTIFCYVIEKRGIHHPPVIEHFIRVTISMMTSLGPYITIFNIKLFREFVFCRKKRERVTSLSIVSSVASPTTKTYTKTF